MLGLKSWRSLKDTLNDRTFLTSFSDTSFQSLVLVPQVKLEKCPQQKFWIGRVCLVEEFFYYNYPFSLPNFFQQKLEKDELVVY